MGAYAIDRKTGKIALERTAFEGAPGNKRHMKSTYASASPATDGRIVVAWFGSQGVHAFEVNGQRLWQVDLGRVNMGAYDIPAYEWGPGSSPINWNGLVFIQCDTQADSFILALDAKTGKTVWKTERDEVPSWGCRRAGDEGRARAGYECVEGRARVRPQDRKGALAAGWQLEDHGADAHFRWRPADCRERPRTGAAIFAARLQARGDVTLAKDTTSNAGVAWSKTGRGPTCRCRRCTTGSCTSSPTTACSTPTRLRPARRFYRQRLPTVGSGFSASPVAADGKIYLSNEDGEMLVVAAGREFKHIATNSMGDLLMATPALSDSV